VGGKVWFCEARETSESTIHFNAATERDFGKYSITSLSEFISA
jgi:hypothetical protein